MAQLLEEIDALAVPGIERLRARVCEDLAVLARASLTVVQQQGAINNLCGAAAELQIWKWAPAPLAMQHGVQSANKADQATVDVVAASGLWWLEVKATAPFGVSSSAWAALRAQVIRLKACAASHVIGRHRPVVIVVFTVGCTDEVACALRILGVHAVRPEQSSGALPPALALAAQLGLPMAKERRPAHLDVSTLLALISSSVHLPPEHSSLQRWAASNEHWKRSLDEEVTLTPRASTPQRALG